METNTQEDQNPDSVTPASTENTAAETSANETSGSFGTSRGSGLSRGKRVAPQPKPSTEVSNASGAPDSVQILTHKSEYKNPFQTEEEETPAPQEVEQKESAPVQESVQNEEVPSIEESPAAETAPTTEEVPAQETISIEEDLAEEKATLNILPPAKPDRSSTQEWGPDSSRERPVFKPEDRQRRRDDSRQRNYEKRDSRKEFSQDEKNTRENREEREDYEDSQKPKKPQGFFGWLKSLFTGKAEPIQPERRGRRNRNGRRRGGNGQGGNRSDGNGGGYRNRNRNRRGNRGNGQGQYRNEGGGGHRNRGYRSRHSSSNHEGRQGSSHKDKE